MDHPPQVMRTLSRIDLLARRYERALGRGRGPLAYARGLDVVSLEYELVMAWQRLPAAWRLGELAAGVTHAGAERVIRRAGAALWKARGRLARRMPDHPDVLRGLRHALATAKEALRDQRDQHRAA